MSDMLSSGKTLVYWTTPTSTTTRNRAQQQVVGLETPTPLL
jgi:hypothetical protein